MATDATLTCDACRCAFTFSRGEQRFYATHGFDKPPSRCAECRAARRLEHGRTSSRDTAAYRGPRQMFQATCVVCGRGALVPFQPRDDQSVSCTRCYARQRKGGYVLSSPLDMNVREPRMTSASAGRDLAHD